MSRRIINGRTNEPSVQDRTNYENFICKSIKGGWLIALRQTINREARARDCNRRGFSVHSDQGKVSRIGEPIEFYIVEENRSRYCQHRDCGTCINDAMRVEIAAFVRLCNYEQSLFVQRIIRFIQQTYSEINSKKHFSSAHFLWISSTQMVIVTLLSVFVGFTQWLKQNEQITSFEFAQTCVNLL